MTSGDSPPEPGGILVSRGSSLRLRNISISIGPNGELEGPPITVELAYDLWPLWLRIAIEHERTAHLARQRLMNLTEEQESVRGNVMEDETAAGMVAISSASFSIDAFYGSVKSRIDNPPPVGTRSRRYAIVAETLKRAFPMSQKASNQLRESLREAFRFRDMTVHPTGEFRGAQRHPVIPVGVAVPHVAFRLENARALVTLALGLVEQCSARPNPRQKSLVEWCAALPDRIAELKALREST